ncbi:hypothetical protein AF332_01990 [Sporosarcina globispora]|uniref:Uncharacterized protein n=1 Tax=Sporosarcina globispora TaxID=1459 RepID=A0A0M0G742_SPOGL|nr:hypothetical protein AF332_01990 [Sporosarcina globispora]
MIKRQLLFWKLPGKHPVFYSLIVAKISENIFADKKKFKIAPSPVFLKKQETIMVIHSSKYMQRKKKSLSIVRAVFLC